MDNKYRKIFAKYKISEGLISEILWSSHSSEGAQEMKVKSKKKKGIRNMKYTEQGMLIANKYRQMWCFI